MCPPKIDKPDAPQPAPKAPPPPAKTAEGFKSAGRNSDVTSAQSSIAKKRKGIDSLRVDLDVPGTQAANGLMVP